MPALDAIVIGGGHNGLVASAYLARAGWTVLVLERLSGPGGAAVSAAPFAGRSERLSRYSYLVSLLPERIVRDLGVRVELRSRPVSAYAPPGLLVDDPADSARTAACCSSGCRGCGRVWRPGTRSPAPSG